MILFYFPGACSLADHIALIETGLSYELVAINHEKKTADGRDLLAINPKGYIPVLELEDGTVLTENSVILNYIAERSGKLLSKRDDVRWRVLEALAFMASEIHGSYQPFFRNLAEPEKERAREKLHKAFSILTDQMGGKMFLVSDEITIADCYLFWILMVAPRSGVDLPVPLRNYFDRMKMRPAVAQALSEENLG